MPDPEPIDASSLIPTSYRVVHVKKLYTPDNQPCQVEVKLALMVDGEEQVKKIVVEPGLLDQMGYPDPTAAFETGFNQIPDLDYSETVLQGVQDWMAGFTNPNVLIQMMVDAVV